jgi:hypothetical protein
MSAFRPLRTLPSKGKITRVADEDEKRWQERLKKVAKIKLEKPE